MSGSRTKASRKKAGAKVAKDRKPQGDKKPAPDPRRVKATLAHVNQALTISLQNVGRLDERLQKNVNDLWHNQSELKNGMDAAEFNLRAHQKVLNGLAIEVERLSNLVSGLLNQEPHELEYLQMANVSLPEDEDGKSQVVRRIDWPYYHKQVEHDLEVLAEYERQQAAERALRDAQIEKAVGLLRQHGKADTLKELAARVAKGEQLLDGFELVGDEVKKVCDLLNLGPLEAKEEAPQGEAPQSEGDGFPEGAVVFGGDEDGVPESDEGNGEPEGGDRGEAHGSSGDVPEGALPEEVLGVRGGEQPQQG